MFIKLKIGSQQNFSGPLLTEVQNCWAQSLNSNDSLDGMLIKCAYKHIMSYYSIHTIYKGASGQVTDFEDTIWHKGEDGEKKKTTNFKDEKCKDL